MTSRSTSWLSKSFWSYKEWMSKTRTNPKTTQMTIFLLITVKMTIMTNRLSKTMQMKTSLRRLHTRISVSLTRALTGLFRVWTLWIWSIRCGTIIDASIGSYLWTATCLRWMVTRQHRWSGSLLRKSKPKLPICQSWNQMGKTQTKSW